MEKLKWVGITNACNNRCLFCFENRSQKKYFKSEKEVKKEIYSGIREGCNRLILSGGEPTLHPDLIKFIKIGKRAGYNKIQILTNGRMFRYKKFLELALKAGLDQIDFSVHGHNSKLHDKLTLAKGSFNQTIKAIKNAIEQKAFVTCDIVVNKKNIRYLPEILEYLIKLGVSRFEILLIIPFGNAWENKEKLLYELKENPRLEKSMIFIRRGLKIAKSAKATIWINRLPPEYLEGYEEYIQDPNNLLKEFYGKNNIFYKKIKQGEKMECYGEMCKFCYMKELCEFIFDCNEKVINKKIERKKEQKNEIIITKNNLLELEKDILKINEKEIILTLVPPEQDYKNYSKIAPRIQEIVKKIDPFLNTKEYKIKNIPLCFIEKKDRKKIIRDKFNLNKEFVKKNRINLEKCINYFIENKKIKGLSCKKCKFYNNCDGIFQKYIMKYGFKELKPIKKGRQNI